MPGSPPDGFAGWGGMPGSPPDGFAGWGGMPGSLPGGFAGWGERLRHLNGALPQPWPRLATRSPGVPSTHGVRAMGWKHGLGLSWPQPDTSSPPLSIALPLGSLIPSPYIH